MRAALERDLRLLTFGKDPFQPPPAPLERCQAPGVIVRPILVGVNKTEQFIETSLPHTKFWLHCRRSIC